MDGGRAAAARKLRFGARATACPRHSVRSEPALIMFRGASTGAQFGWSSRGVAVCCALRLARFNRGWCRRPAAQADGYLDRGSARRGRGLRRPSIGLSRHEILRAGYVPMTGVLSCPCGCSRASPLYWSRLLIRRSSRLFAMGRHRPLGAALVPLPGSRAAISILISRAPFENRGINRVKRRPAGGRGATGGRLRAGRD